MPAHTTLNRLARIAQDQWGLVTRRQAEHAGVSPATLQRLAGDVPLWERAPRQGVVSHRSAAAVYELGHLPADRHEFTLPVRRQSRREDVRLHLREVTNSE